MTIPGGQELLVVLLVLALLGGGIGAVVFVAVRLATRDDRRPPQDPGR